MVESVRFGVLLCACVCILQTIHIRNIYRSEYARMDLVACLYVCAIVYGCENLYSI